MAGSYRPRALSFCPLLGFAPSLPWRTGCPVGRLGAHERMPGTSIFWQALRIPSGSGAHASRWTLCRSSTPEGGGEVGLSTLLETSETTSPLNLSRLHFGPQGWALALQRASTQTRVRPRVARPRAGPPAGALLRFIAAKAVLQGSAERAREGKAHLLPGAQSRSLSRQPKDTARSVPRFWRGQTSTFPSSPSTSKT